MKEELQGAMAELDEAQAAIAELGRIDILVNNAGVNPAMMPAMDADITSQSNQLMNLVLNYKEVIIQFQQIAGKFQQQLKDVNIDTVNIALLPSSFSLQQPISMPWLR
jgi:NAD(P)-dependent dehydrogenase (short-subunit alcohol dehydrogenase family)